MADLGELMGSLMSGLIRARRMADEQTAALAEYYKSNPLLEGLSVPRIRIPELVIDMPFIIEEHIGGETGKMEEPAKIASEVKTQLKATLSKNNIKVNIAFNRAFSNELKRQLALLKQAKVPVMKETIARSVQSAFADALAKSKTPLSGKDQETIAGDLRTRAGSVGLAKEPVASRIAANIKSADVKEQTSPANVVRLKITLKEEGLEWATQASESGGVVRTLQPE